MFFTLWFACFVLLLVEVFCFFLPGAQRVHCPVGPLFFIVSSRSRRRYRISILVPGTYHRTFLDVLTRA